MITLGNLNGTQSTVLRLLRRKGSASRAELAAACGITPAAVSVLSRDLLDGGLIREGARRAGGRGAPHIDLMLSPSAGHALGIHATRHTIAVALLDFGGAVIAEICLNGNFERFADACTAIAKGTAIVRRQAPDPSAPLIGAGIAMPTRFSTKDTELDLADEVSAWAGDHLDARLRELLQCPVLFENDANAAAIGELALGNREGYRDFTYLYLSEGIGGALILNGELYRGHSGNAGEVGLLHARDAPRPSFEDFVKFCAAEDLKDIPTSRDQQAWEEFIRNNVCAVETWLQRAVPQVAEIVFAVTAVVAPKAVFVGGTLPLTLRRALVDRVTLRHGNPKRGLIAPDLSMPAIRAEDAVAFGAAAAVLHHL